MLPHKRVERAAANRSHVLVCARTLRLSPLVLVLPCWLLPQNDAYKYPDIYVCTYNFYGCDDDSLLENCTRSAHSTEGGNSTAIFNKDGDDRQELEVGVLHTGQVTPPCFRRMLLILSLISIVG